jgi:hypothetical protein
MSASDSRPLPQDHGWFFDQGAWRPVKVAGQEEHHLVVQRRDGSLHRTSLFDFLWERPSHPDIPVRED